MKHKIPHWLEIAWAVSWRALLGYTVFNLLLVDEIRHDRVWLFVSVYFVALSIGAMWLVASFCPKREKPKTFTRDSAQTHTFTVNTIPTF